MTEIDLPHTQDACNRNVPMPFATGEALRGHGQLTIGVIKGKAPRISNHIGNLLRDMTFQGLTRWLHIVRIFKLKLHGLHAPNCPY